ncbi:hypothetical protein MK079_02320 [Candidatus Gracilibacteria bacterium]|nr:hypothetical protein [Candidatus Gracilibacteria bacterium]
MQQENKKQKNILLSLLFYGFTSLICIVVFFSFFFPQLRAIELLKSEAKTMYHTLNTTLSQGMDFSTFKSEANQFTQTPYQAQLLKNMSAQLYNSVFVNTGSLGYDAFLDTLKDNFVLNSSSTNEQKELVNTLLPIYGGEDDNPFVLTDYKFINYIESILETFDLEYEGLIGIQSPQLVEAFSSQNSKNALETSIFALPIDLNIRGSKRAMLDFFHYIEHAGNTYLEDGNISLHRDDVLSRGVLPVVLKGQTLSRSYNIYKNQILDIAKISMKDYIDSSLVQREEQSFVDFIKATRGSEAFETEITLHFYVQGVPQYKIEHHITTTIQQYQKLKKQLESLRKKSDIDPATKVHIETNYNYLKSIQTDITTLQSNMKKKIRLQDMYVNSQQYESSFERIAEQFNIAL